MTHDELHQLYSQHRYAEVQHLAIEMIREKTLNVQAWIDLMDALISQQAMSDAAHVFQRASILDPLGSWVDSHRAILDAVPMNPPSEWLASLLAVPRVTVSAAMIVRDGERTIRESLEHLRDAVDEIVVVDTGSTDRTVDIVQSLGIPVHHWEWTDDFSAARNYALSLVTQQWVLWVDADEILHPDDVDVPRTVAGLFHEIPGALLCRVIQLNRQPQGRILPDASMCRLFPTGRGIHYWRRIHEQPYPQALNFHDKAPIATALVRIRLDHDGYNREVVDIEQKLRRNIRLLTLSVTDDPDDIASCGFLAREWFTLGDRQQAIQWLQRVEELAPQSPVYARLSGDRYLFCEILCQEGRLEEALAVATRSVERDPDFPGAWFALAQVELLMGERHIQQSIQHFNSTQQRLVDYRGVVTMDKSVGDWRVHLGLADASRLTGNLAQAREIYQEVLSRYPQFAVVQRQLQMIETQREQLNRPLS